MVKERNLCYTIIDHTADLGIIVRGKDPEDLFEKAAGSFMHLMVKMRVPTSSETMNISVKAQDLEDLMVRWLGELLYLFQGEHKVTTHTAVVLTGNHNLEAKVQTVPFKPTNHEIRREIKAVTYHQIRVSSKGGLWTARIIFDL